VTTPDVDRTGVGAAVRAVALGAGVVILVEAALLWATDAGHEGISVTTAVMLPLLAALALLAVAETYRRPERWTVPTVAAVTVFALLAIPVLLGLVHTLRGGFFDAR
jgi:hypothetical protein